MDSSQTLALTQKFQEAAEEIRQWKRKFENGKGLSEKDERKREKN
ncbi:hypothetical protein [Bacillus sp. Bos-x628]